MAWAGGIVPVLADGWVDDSAPKVGGVRSGRGDFAAGALRGNRMAASGGYQ